MMVVQYLHRRLRHALYRFATATRANVTVTFALALIPIVGFVGAAVDYSHANSVKVAMQAATDSTALMLSKEAPSLTRSQIQEKAEKYFKAVFNRPEVTDLKIAANYTTNGGPQVILSATSDVNTDFMGLMGFDSLKIGVESQVKWGNTRLRVALALDNTGSMKDDGKMSALKKATKNLLKQLEGAASRDGDVYVSVIPFNKDVNVGKSNYNQSWVSFDDHPGYDGWDSQNGKTETSTVCTGRGRRRDCKTTSSWVPGDHKTWNGCVTDRDQNYDTTNTAPSTGNKATLFPAEQFSSCPAQLLELSYDWEALEDKVDDMDPNGNTNQTIGLQWAFQSLTSAPFTIPAKDSSFKYSEAIILLTDGLNTQSRFSSNRSSIDARMSKACANAKAADITICAVQVNTGGDPTQDVLKACASSSDKFFELKKANDVVATFNSIGTALSNLRIAQ